MLNKSFILGLLLLIVGDSCTKNIMTIGHRGSSDKAVENSIEAFIHAIELGLNMIELDVFPCKSGELIVMHDDTLDRTTNGAGKISQMTLDEIRQYRLTDGQEIPTLDQVFDAVDRRCKINIELKPSCYGLEQKIIDLVKEYVDTKGWKYTDFQFSSFDHYILLACREQLPEVPRGAIMSGLPIGYAEFGTLVGATSINMSAKVLRQELIDDAHSRGMEICIWVVNNKKDIEKLVAMGVDGIFTDNPILFKDINGACD